MVIYIKQIEMEHIPRTIFGVKFNKRLLSGNNNFIYNQYSLYFTKNEQLKAYKSMLNDTWTFSEVKLIKWHLNCNEEQREDTPHPNFADGNLK